MKKIISILTCLVIIVAALPSVLAAQTLSINEDYSTLKLGEENYVQCVDELYYTLEPIAVDFDLQLTSKQKKLFEEVYVYENNEAFLEVRIEFKNGGYMSATYLNEKYLDDYNDLLEGNAAKYELTDWYGEETKEIEISQLKGEKKSVCGYEIDTSVEIDVVGYDESGKILILYGRIYLDPDYAPEDEKYIYVDYFQFGADAREEFYVSDYNDVEAYVIEDVDVQKWVIEHADQSVDFVYDEDVGGVITIIVCILLFAVVPLVLLVLSIIFAVRKKRYRKLYLITMTLCIIELLAFALLAFIIFV